MQTINQAKFMGKVQYLEAKFSKHLKSLFQYNIDTLITN